MEFFQFCLEIINREARKFNVPFDTSELKKLTISTANNANYDLINKRSHFLYRCGAIKLHFAKVCFKKFLLEHNVIESLLPKWNNCADLTFCSLSSGPALDYIALLHSFQESKLTSPLFNNIKIVAKYGAWRNTINIMHDIICEGNLKGLSSAIIRKIKVIQGDPFKDLSQKVKSTVGSSDAIIMMQRLNLQVGAYDQKKTSKSIQVFLDTLKPGAVLFCIDTKQTIKEIIPLLNSVPGRFLLQPVCMNTQIDFVCPNVINERVGCLPLLSTNGTFFVWEKSLESIKCKLSPRDKSVMNCSLPSTSSQITDDSFKRKDQTIDLNSSHLELATVCTQTEPDELLQATETKKVIELTQRIENLTAELTELLENSDSKCCVEEQCFVKNRETCNNLVSNDCICDHYSTRISCSRFSDSNENCKTCNESNSLSQCCCSCNYNKIRVTSNGFEASNCSNFLINPNLTTSVESNLSSAHLIIPLRNLSPDVVSQIIALLSQSNET